MWTIEYANEEKSFEALGFSSEVMRQRTSMARDTITLRAAGPMDGALQFAYGAPVVIRRDRVQGAGGLEGGTIYFRGKAALPQRIGSGKEEAIAYQFVGPWWDFERLVFQQEWKIFQGWSTPGDPNTPPTFATTRTSEVFLGQAIGGGRLTTGEQIAEAVQWAGTCGVAVQVGSIDPAANIPTYNARDITVAEVIVQMVRWTPDVVCWFDYTTTPPTFNCRKAANLVEVPLIADGVIGAVDLVPRYDLQTPAVCLRFKATNMVDGRPSTVFEDQNAPVNATGTELGASVHTIELAGSVSNNVYGELECAPVAAQSVNAAQRLAWWQQKDPTLASTKIDPASLSVSIASIVDQAGNPVSLANFPNELLNGQAASWMTVGGGAPVNVVHATVKAIATYDLYRIDAGWLQVNKDKFAVTKKRTKELSVNIRLTNGTSGTYETLGSYTAGESAPAGLAAEIYNSRQALQYEGRITLPAEEVPSGIGIGNKIALTVGTTNYSGLMVQAMHEDLGLGTVTLTFGPAAHLGLHDLIGLLRVNRYRLVYNNPATRTGAAVGGNGNVLLGKATAKENTTAGLGNHELFGASADLGDGGTAAATLDASGKKMLLEVVNADGTLKTSEGSVNISLADAAGAEIKLRVWDVCKEVNGVMVQGTAVFLSGPFVQNP